MNFEEYMNCHNDNDGFLDNDFGAMDPCFGDPNNDFEEDNNNNNNNNNSRHCKCKCKCKCDKDDDYDDDPCDDDGEYIDNGLDCEQTWRPDPCKRVPQSGTLNLVSRLDCAQGEPLENAPVSLYKVDRGCEKLIGTKKTDENGAATFTCLEDGIYRVEQDLDPCLFECAQYYPSAHFAIRPGHRNQRMIIVHKRRRLVDKCTMRAINKAVNAAVKKAMCCCKCRCRCR